MLDTKEGEPSIRIVAQRTLTKGVPSAPGDTDVAGDVRKSRSSSVGDSS